MSPKAPPPRTGGGEVGRVEIGAGGREGGRAGGRFPKRMGGAWAIVAKSGESTQNGRQTIQHTFCHGQPAILCHLPGCHLCKGHKMDPTVGQVASMMVK